MISSTILLVHINTNLTRKVAVAYMWDWPPQRSASNRQQIYVISGSSTFKQVFLVKVPSSFSLRFLGRSTERNYSAS